MTDVVTERRPMQLMWSEALRALVCRLPMLVATALGQTTYLVTLGQGAFFISSLFLPRRTGARFVMGSLVLGLGLGIYLIGGTVAPYPWVALIFTFFVCLNLSYMTNWKVGGPLALTLVMIYTAGLNTGSPEKVSANFLVFAFVMGWSTLISLLPSEPAAPAAGEREPERRRSVRAGPSDGHRHRPGPGHLLLRRIRQDRLGPQRRRQRRAIRRETVGKSAWARFFGTLGGAAMASIALAFITDPTIVVLIGAVFAVLNGLFKLTTLGKMPLFYTATILLLYTANDLTTGSENVLTRSA